jgi:hypothetical protein
VVDGDALEMRFGETQRGFESPPLRYPCTLSFRAFNLIALKLYSQNSRVRSQNSAMFSVRLADSAALATQERLNNRV